MALLDSRPGPAETVLGFILFSLLLDLTFRVILSLSVLTDFFQFWRIVVTLTPWMMRTVVPSVFPIFMAYRSSCRCHDMILVLVLNHYSLSMFQNVGTNCPLTMASPSLTSYSSLKHDCTPKFSFMFF